MWNDLTQALRVMRRYPASSTAIVLVLALGIGANTAMFAGFHAWVLRPLAFEEPERLVAPYSTRPRTGEREHLSSAPDVADWRRESRTLEGIALFDRHAFDFQDPVDSVRIEGARVEASLFPLLGVEPALGRGFSQNEDLPGQPRAVALISDSLWRERFGGDRGVIGEHIALEGRSYRIVGVMEPGFAFPEHARVWVALGLDPDAFERDQRVFDSIARLAPGVSREEATAELGSIAERLAQRYPQTNRGWSVELLPLREKWLPPSVRAALAASLGASFLALLVICANVTGLFLAQANARRREMAVRVALGAGRRRLARQTLTESTALAVCGSLLGVPAAILLNRWVMSWAPIDPPYLFDMVIDGRAVAFAAVTALVAGTVCGLAPLLRHRSFSLGESLGSSGGRGGDSPRAQRLGAALVVAELALSTALGIGSLLVARSFLEQRASELGYRVRDVFTMRLHLSSEAYLEPEARRALVERALERITGLAQVQAAGVTSRLPAGQGWNEARLAAQGVPTEIGEELVARAHGVTPGYLQALRIPLLDGRGFTASEMREEAPVALVSDTLSTRLWPGESPLNRRFVDRRRPDDGSLRIIGVVGDVEAPQGMLASEGPRRLQIYRPWSARRDPEPTLVLRADAGRSAAVTAARDVLRRLDASLPVSEVRPLAEAVEREQWVSRFFSQLLALYASMAVAIAMVGAYGLAADSVGRRSRELAVRVALGARRRQALALVMRQGLAPGIAGVTTGIAVALALTPFAASMVVGISVRDPLVFVTVPVLLLLANLVAIWIPARIAASIEPARVLRSE